MIISFANVEKYFYYQHQRTLKELVDAAFRRRKTIERVHALNNVSFGINKGETVGVIGRNGAGKSTMLKLIAGVSVPTSGKVSVEGQVTPLLELGAGFHPDLTGRENVFLNGVILGHTEKFLKEKLPGIIVFAGLSDFVDVPVKFYSSGMYMRLAFAVAVFTQPEILLVDEILAVGDIEFQKKCLAKMAEFKKNGVTIVFVSHAMGTVKDFCSRVLYLQKGSLVFDGDPTEAIKKYEAERTVAK